MRRRAFLALTATTTAAVTTTPAGPVQGETSPGQALTAGLRDAMLGLGSPDTDRRSVSRLLDAVRADYAACQYGALSRSLPALIRAGHASGEASSLAQGYLVATRMLIKLDDQELGYLAADRARQLARQADDVLTEAESARQLAVLTRRSGWLDQAASIALTAADDPRLQMAGPGGAALRGLLVQSAAYTAAKAGDRGGMRELTDEAAVLAGHLGPQQIHVQQGGGFGWPTVQLHRISAESSAGDPLAALAAAQELSPSRLPTLERRSRYYADVAAAHAHRGDRSECLRALLAAEQVAPEETYARPAVRALISGLLLSGRTTSDLRALAARSRVAA